MKPFDLQVNGYAGTDFCSSSLNSEQLHHACRALADDGVDGILATLITDDLPSLVAKLSNLVRLRGEDELARRVIVGFHVEAGSDGLDHAVIVETHRAIKGHRATVHHRDHVLAAGLGPLDRSTEPLRSTCCRRSWR